MFSYQLTKMTEFGLVDKTMSKWLGGWRPDSLEDRIILEDADVLGWGNLFFPVLVLAAGAAGSVGVLALEQSCQRWLRSKDVAMSHAEKVQGKSRTFPNGK